MPFPCLLLEMHKQQSNPESCTLFLVEMKAE